MLVKFLPIFVTDTKIFFVYNFVDPLNRLPQNAELFSNNSVAQ